MGIPTQARHTGTDKATSLMLMVSYKQTNHNRSGFFITNTTNHRGTVFHNLNINIIFIDIMKRKSNHFFKNLSEQLLCGILLLFIAGCSKNNTNDDSDTPVPPIVNDVSGNIKKISFSTKPGKAGISVFEKDNLNRLVTVSHFAEDSTNGVISTLTGKSVFEYEGNEDRPKIYYEMYLDGNKLDTLFKVFNYYNSNSQIIKDSLIWIAYYDRQLYIINDHNYTGSWVISHQKDVLLGSPYPSTRFYIDSMNFNNGNLTYYSTNEFDNAGSLLHHQSTYESQFDNKINPLKKLNIYKYAVNQYVNPTQGFNNLVLQNAKGSATSFDQMKHVYNYSSNNYPLSATQSLIIPNVEKQVRVIKYFYE